MSIVSKSYMSIVSNYIKIIPHTTHLIIVLRLFCDHRGYDDDDRGRRRDRSRSDRAIRGRRRGSEERRRRRGSAGWSHVSHAGAERFWHGLTVFNYV